MGLFGALFAGVSGLSSQSNKIGIISNNVSNVNTVGFKEGQAAFNTLVVPSGTTNFSPGGVIGNTQQLVNQQGLIQATSSPTDIAITGNGFFAVNTQSDGSGSLRLTRAGSFTQDSSGNFINANGFFLQGIPVTTPPTSVNTNNLKTVTVNQSATGTATATSLVSLAANFNAAQAVLLGSGVTGTMQAINGTSPNNIGITGSQIIASNDKGGAPTNNLTRGNTLQIVSGAPASATDTFTYGGFTIGRNVGDATAAGDGDGGNALNTETLVNNGISTSGSGAVANTTNSAITGINVSDKTLANLPFASGLFTAGNLTIGSPPATTVVLAGNESLNTIAANIQAALRARAGDPGTSTATVTGNPGNYAITVTDKRGSGETGFGGPAVTTGTPTFTVVAPTNSPSANQLSLTVNNATIQDYTIGQNVYISGAAAIGTLSAANINGARQVVGIDVTNNKIIVTTGVNDPNGAATPGGGSAISVTNRTYPFTGTILNATSETSDFLSNGVTPLSTTNFSSTAIKLIITAGSNTPATFSYSPTPNPTTGTFNSLDTLATAISASPGLTARVVSGRLYVSATDATQALTFTNGDAVGNGTLPGINWTQELDLRNLAAPASTAHMFNSLSGLAQQINSFDPTNLLAVVNNPNSSSTITINEANPKQTINFTDGQLLTNGSILKEFGIANLTSNAGTETTGALAVKYDPTTPSHDMSSGAVTPQFSHDVTIFDAQGNAHTIAMNVVKLATNSWGVELTAVPATDVISTIKNGSFPNGDGQIAAGTVTFSGTGAVTSVTGTLAGAIPINWTNGALAGSITVNLGLGSTTAPGLTQSAAPYNVSLASQNGAPIGQLTGVAIDSNGFVTETFSNGQTQRVFQIPLANVSNPDGLESVSGDAFQETLASGQVNLNDAGTGGTGTIAPSALEQSNVDLSTQLTSLIVAQQAYGANSKLLTVADQLLQQLDQIIQ